MRVLASRNTYKETLLLRLSDARNFGRSLAGLCLIAGPLVMLVASIVAPDTDHKNKLRELSAIAAHKGTYVTSGLLYLVGSLILMAAAVA
jgi:hypothetical protein